jgi:ribonuclease P protein component
MGGAPGQAMAVSVSKRLFKSAVDRNLLKRRIREAYRLNKSKLSNLRLQNEKTILLVIQYQHKQIADFQTIEESLMKGLTKLAEQLGEPDKN